MDPNAALANLRDTYAPLRNMLAATNGNLAEAAEDMLNAIEALDEWLSKGGFPPAAWSPFNRTPE
jgi:hypothetical protein